MGHIMPENLEALVVEKVVDVPLGSGKEVVETDNFMSLIQKPLTHMRAQKASTAGDQYRLGHIFNDPPIQTEVAA